MTASRFARLPLVGVTLALALALTGCTPSTPTAEETAAPSPSEMTPSPTATTTTKPTADPAVATCENLLDLSTLEAILTTGYDVNPVNDYIEKIRGEGSPYALFDEYGGVVCPVNNGSRVTELYGYSPITPDQQAVQEARLVSEGFVARDFDGGTLYELEPQEGIVFAFYFRNGFWWCGYDSGIIEMIVANSPES